MEIISSTSNPKIKKLVALQQKSSERRESSLFVVEGRRELQHCINSGFEVDTLFVCPEILGEEAAADMARIAFPSPDDRERKCFEITPAAYSKVAYREGTEGIIAEIRYRSISLGNLQLKENPLVIVVESVEKPGNLGAVLRSADAAGADAVIMCDPLTDIFNPNLIRASIGAVFTVPTVTCSSTEAIKWLKENKIQVLTAQLQDSSWYYDTDMKKGTAIVIGTEAAGLSDQWRKAADAHIKIPMSGQLDSLNASVSAAILMFEAVRQRNA